MNIKDWEKEFNEKFTVVYKANKDIPFDQTVLNTSNPIKIKTFIEDLLSQSNQEIVKEIEGLKTSKLNTTASWNDFDMKHRTMTLEEVGYEQGFNEAVDEFNDRIDKLLNQLRQSNLLRKKLVINPFKH